MAIQTTYSSSFKSASGYSSETSLIWPNIPQEIFQKIAYHLEPWSVISFALTKRNVKFLATDPQIWNFFLQRAYPDSWTALKSELKDDSALEEKSLTFYKLLKIADRNIVSGKYQRKEFTSHPGIYKMLIHDNKLISSPALSLWGPVKVYDLNSQKELKSFPTYDALFRSHPIAYDNVLAICNSSHFNIYDFNSGEELPFGKLVRGYLSVNHEQIQKVLACNGKFVVLFKNVVKVYDLNSSQELMSFDFHGYTRSDAPNFYNTRNGLLAYENKLIVQLEHVIKIYDLNCGEERLSLDFQKDETHGILASNNKLVVQLFNSQSKDNKIKVFNLDSGQELISLNLPEKIWHILSNDNGLIVFSESYKCTVYDLDCGQKVLEFQIPKLESYHPNVLTCDRKLFAVIPGDPHKIQVYDLNTGKKLQTIEAPNYSCMLFHDYQLMIGHRYGEWIDILDFKDATFSQTTCDE